MIAAERNLFLLFTAFALFSPAAIGQSANSPGGNVRAPGAITDTSTHHFEYVFPEGWIYVYDIDSNHTLWKIIPLPQTRYEQVRGEAVCPATGMLYVSYGGDGGQYGNGSLLAFDLLRDTVLWTKSYAHGIDSHAITPDGTTIFMPDGELSSSGIWHVVSAADGSEIGSIQTHGSGPHNTVMSLDGAQVYLGERDISNLGDDSLYVASTQPPYSITKTVGKTLSGVRPFSVDGAQTYAFIGITNLLGFQVLDLKSDAVRWTIDLTTMGFPRTPCGLCPTAPSHGISLSPDEREIYVVDQPNSYVHVFDVSGTIAQGTVPLKVADIPLAHQFTGSDSSCIYDCSRDGWLHHSVDGHYVYVGEAGDVIDTHTRSIVAYLPALRNTRQLLEIDFRNGLVSATSTRTSIGKLASAAKPSTPTPSFPPSGATNQLTTLTLAWNPPAGATSYHLQVALDALFAVKVVDDSTITAASAPVALAPLTGYFWRVSAGNIYGTSGWSTVGLFTTAPSGASVYDFSASWNLVSLPLRPADAIASVLFPAASHPAFTYGGGGYVEAETLRAGTGYWVDFSTPQTIAFVGTTLSQDTVEVMRGWNMVGGISTPLASSSVGSIPPGLLTSPFFEYTAGASYSLADSLLPSRGYWVKTDGPGFLILSSHGGVNSNRIRMELNGGELPPPPPSGDPAGHLPVESHAFRLGQNYPNPFNPSTIISYDLPSPGNVSLKIYDVLGREVATLVNLRRQGAGHYSVRWDASGLTSGVYFSRLSFGGLVQTRKLFLLK